MKTNNEIKESVKDEYKSFSAQRKRAYHFKNLIESGNPFSEETYFRSIQIQEPDINDFITTEITNSFGATALENIEVHLEEEVHKALLQEQFNNIQESQKRQRKNRSKVVENAKQIANRIYSQKPLNTSYQSSLK